MPGVSRVRSTYGVEGAGEGLVFSGGARQPGRNGPDREHGRRGARGREGDGGRRKRRSSLAPGRSAARRIDQRQLRDDWVRAEPPASASTPVRRRRAATSAAMRSGAPEAGVRHRRSAGVRAPGHGDNACGLFARGCPDRQGPGTTANLRQGGAPTAVSEARGDRSLRTAHGTSQSPGRRACRPFAAPARRFSHRGARTPRSRGA